MGRRVSKQKKNNLIFCYWGKGRLCVCLKLSKSCICSNTLPPQSICCLLLLGFLKKVLYSCKLLTVRFKRHIEILLIQIRHLPPRKTNWGALILMHNFGKYFHALKKILQYFEILSTSQCRVCFWPIWLTII